MTWYLSISKLYAYRRLLSGLDVVAKIFTKAMVNSLRDRVGLSKLSPEAEVSIIESSNVEFGRTIIEVV